MDEGDHHDPAKVLAFLNQWRPHVVHPEGCEDGSRSFSRKSTMDPAWTRWRGTSRERAPMTTTREASLAAEAWMREEGGRHPELVGAILAGLIRTRDPEEPHPSSSDVDLFIYVDAEVPSEILD